MELEHVKITAGRWAYMPLDQAWPDTLRVYEGSWEHRGVVGYITKHQALAYWRHWDNAGIWWSIQDGNRRQIDIRVIGDVDAFCGDDE